MKEQLRVSATDLDALRRYLGDEDSDLADLVAQLRREMPPTPPMLAGTAFHEALENLPEGEFDSLRTATHHFDFKLDGEIELPTVREMKETRLYQIDGVRVTLVGKVDAAHGKRIDDHKLTSRYDAERFLGSMQWRCYLEVFRADEFRWNIFEGREVAPNHWVIGNLHRLTMHRYPGMHLDVIEALRQFVGFARTHLPERLMPWEPTAADFLAAG